MAKRRRLTPARSDYLIDDELIEPMPPLETKAFPLGVAPTRSIPRPPIAQVAGDTSATAALQELTDMVAKARNEGRMIQDLALDEVDAGHLVRDRVVVDEDEMQALIGSIRARGQQTPIEVLDRGESTEPRYGLISGWRRIQALARLAEEDGRFSRVLALIRAPQSASDAYVAMVEENEIRVGLSYYERARIVGESVGQGVYPDAKSALHGLFGNVSRAKRSKIKSFMRIVEELDGALKFPGALGERLGLDLSKRLAEGAGAEIRAELAARGAMTAEEEQEILKDTPLVGSFDDREHEQPRSQRENIDPHAGINVKFDEDRGRIVLSGVQVDRYFLDELEAWLAGRT